MDETTILDGHLPSPVCAIVVGPSNCGKSTFVKNIILHQADLFRRPFDYMYIILGTSAQDNEILTSLTSAENLPHGVKVIEASKFLPPDDPNVSLKDTKFQSYIKSLITAHKKQGQHGCLVFDDLMSELSDCDMLTQLFSKISSHQDVSVFFITQNLFHKGGGKRATDHVTVFRNTKMLVVFNPGMDSSVFSLVAQRIANKGRIAAVSSMLEEKAREYRYVVILGDLNTPQVLRFRSNLFDKQEINGQMVPCQTIFHDAHDNTTPETYPFGAIET